MSTEVTEAGKPTTAAAWKKAKIHNVCCPSGVRVDIQIPDLPELIIAGQIPQHLLDAALGAAADEDTKPSVEMLRQQTEFTNTLLAITVISPKITEADAAGLPYEDKEFLVSLATRQRDTDVLGDHIGGLREVEKFRRFREIDEFSPTLADF